MKVTKFNSIKTSDGTITGLSAVLSEISNGTHKSQIDEIRWLKSCHTFENEQAADDIKRSLPAFIPSLLTLDKSELNHDDQPTGLIQLDIDLSKNEHVDMAEVKSQLSYLPYVAYVFFSPSGGIKAAVKTDFVRLADEDIENTKKRFAIAYDRVVSVITGSMNVTFDKAMSSIKALCFVSCDPDIYINLDANNLALGSIDLPAPTKPSFEFNAETTVTPEFVVDLLSYIPRNADYDLRRDVAYVVFQYLGHSAYAVLMDHFIKEPRKLRTQLEAFEKYKKYADIGRLVNLAKQHGYRPKQTQSRKFEVSKSTDFRFDAPISVDAAQYKLRALMADGILNKSSHYISMSCGVGKTDTMVETIIEYGSDLKILIFAPNGQLQQQIYQTFEEKYNKDENFFRALQKMGSIKLIRGRTADSPSGAMCVKQSVVTGLQRIHAGLPVSYCYSCSEFRNCSYINQFQLTDKIRIAPTASYYAGPGQWDGGRGIKHNDDKPNDQKFKPDLIIIDEDAIQIDTISVTSTTPYRSLAKILSLCDLGYSLASAVKRQSDMILTELREAKLLRASLASKLMAQPTLTASYYDPNHVQILEMFRDYILSGFDDKFLEGLRFKYTVHTGGYHSQACIEHNAVRKPHAHYQDVTTIYLDATAEEAVVKSVYPEVPFTKLIVQQTSDVEIYQLEGTSVSKDWLKTRSNVDKLVTRIRSELTTEACDNVKIGLITHRKIGDDDQFYKTLAREIGAEVFGYFGNLRGSNAYADVDYLFIVGRYAANGRQHERFGHAVFQHDWVGDTEYVDQPIAMHDGTSRALNARLHINTTESVIYRHCSTHETIQAVGRARPIHGKSKKVFLFTNESLGEDVQVTGFFQIEQSPFEKAISNIRTNVFLELSDRKTRLEFGITDYTMKKHKERFISDAIDSGLEHVVIEGKDRHRHDISRTFLTANTVALIASLEASNTTVTTWKRLG